MFQATYKKEHDETTLFREWNEESAATKKSSTNEDTRHPFNIQKEKFEARTWIHSQPDAKEAGQREAMTTKRMKDLHKAFKETG